MTILSHPLKNEISYPVRAILSKISSITIGNADIMKSSVVRNLGSHIGDKWSMNSHIKNICDASFYYLHRQIRSTHRVTPSTVYFYGICQAFLGDSA